MIASYFAEIEYLIAEEALPYILIADDHNKRNLVGWILPQQFLSFLIDEGPRRVVVETDQFNDLALSVLDERGEFDVLVDTEVDLRGICVTCSGLLCLEMGFDDF